MVKNEDVAIRPRYQAVNPATGEVIDTFETATDVEMGAAIELAYSAHSVWKSAGIEGRAATVQRIGNLFAERAGDLAAIATAEMGKSLPEARDEAAFCGSIFGYYAAEGPSLLADQMIKTFSRGTAIVQKLPLGPLLGIMPWNYPFYQVARFAAPNLMLGNTIILKHAESCPGSASAIQRIMDDAGLPRGAYLNIFATHGQIERIIADPRIRGVSLTGSERAGAAVASIAGKNLKKCVLELGGSDPYVILDSNDIDESANTAWQTRMSNTGQACNGNKRMIVMADIYDDFVEKLVRKADGLQPGNPAGRAVGTFGPLASRAAAEHLAEQVQDAVTKGATLHVGGKLSNGSAAYFSPAILTGVTKEMRAYREELFGPVAVVYCVGSDEEAIALANDTIYGLGGAVFSTDTERAKRVADALEVGMANVNTPAGEGVEIPFGGVKNSGFGRELGPLGMDEFANKRLFYTAG